MAQRTICLCDGEYIGIETIFTVIDGKQINIKDKVEALRKKSRQNNLTCPCGCGAVLILVASDNNLREQHFRLKDRDDENRCNFKNEGKCSIDSKIILKCWLDDKLKDDNLESRVPICGVDDINRKYEFTFLSRAKSIAISYSYDRVNLSDEKFDILESNSKGIKIIYIVDKSNEAVCGQYPEKLMKIQERQGYCLYLSLSDDDNYYKAKFDAVFFEQNVEGLWQEIKFASGIINQFDITERGEILFDDNTLTQLLVLSKEKFIQERELIKKRCEQEKIKKEIQRQMEKEEAEKLIVEYNKQKQIETERIEREEKEKKEAFIERVKNDFENKDTPIRDENGKRWFKCKHCGKIERESEFGSCGGIGSVNMGNCKECEKNNPDVYKEINAYFANYRKTVNTKVCPRCGGKLKERSGVNGSFIGCNNFPKCRYTRNINKK